LDTIINVHKLFQFMQISVNFDFYFLKPLTKLVKSIGYCK